MSRVSYDNPPISQSGNEDDVNTTYNPGFDKIRLEAVGFVGGLRSHILPVEIIRLEKLGIQLTISEALKAALSPTIEGLSIRDLIPGFDFEDGNDNPIQMRHWRQPWSGNYSSTSGEFEVYRSNKDVDYDKKVIGIWGCRYVNTGPSHLGNVTSTSTITFKDSAGNTYDHWQVEGLDVNTEAYAFTPLIFNPSRQLRIFHYPKTDKSGSFDNIQLLGAVCERRGDNVNGLQHPNALSSL